MNLHSGGWRYDRLGANRHGCNTWTGCQPVSCSSITDLILKSWKRAYITSSLLLEFPASRYPNSPARSIWKRGRAKTWSQSGLRWRRWAVSDWSEGSRPGRTAATAPLFNRSLLPCKPARASPQVRRLISFYTCGDKIDSLLIPVFPLAVRSLAEHVAACLTSVRERKQWKGRQGTGRGGGYI